MSSEHTLKMFLKSFDQRFYQNVTNAFSDCHSKDVLLRRVVNMSETFFPKRLKVVMEKRFPLTNWKRH